MAPAGGALTKVRSTASVAAATFLKASTPVVGAPIKRSEIFRQSPNWDTSAASAQVWALILINQTDGSRRVISPQNVMSIC